MNRLEEALRETFGSDLTTTDAPTAAGVRKGVRRRRTTRATLGAGAAVAALVVGAALVRASVDGGGQPQPAPSPEPTEPRFSSALAVESVGDALLVTADDPGCACSVLHRLEAGRWTVLHEFPVEFVERLEMAPDGLHGWAAKGRSVWRTADGGGTWTDVTMPRNDDDDLEASYSVAVSDRWAWIVDHSGGILHRSPVDAGGVARVTVPGVVGSTFTDAQVAGVAVVGDHVVVDLAPTTEGSVTSSPIFADPDGGAWQPLPRPCEGEHQLVEAETVLFTTCEDTGEPEATVYRWEAGEDGFVGFSAARGPFMNLAPLDDGRVLVTGDRDLVLSADSEVVADTGLPADASIWDAEPLDGTDYLATTHGLLASTDGGRTWHRI